MHDRGECGNTGEKRGEGVALSKLRLLFCACCVALHPNPNPPNLRRTRRHSPPPTPTPPPLLTIPNADANYQQKKASSNGWNRRQICCIATVQKGERAKGAGAEAVQHWGAQMWHCWTDERDHRAGGQTNRVLILTKLQQLLQYKQ